MSEESYPVTVLAQLPDGSVAPIRVGTAVRTGDGFRLSLGELSIGPHADRVEARASRASAPASRGASPSGDRGLVFPPYGRSKGAPIAGASVQDLEFYIAGSRRSLDDPSKARWHEKERVLLAAMEAELARQRGGGGRANELAPPLDDDAPPYSDDDAPPQSDDDIPF